MSSSGVSVDSTVVSSRAAASTAGASSAALYVGYTYPLAAYLKFPPWGIRYHRCPLDGTTDAAAEVEAAAALASSDIEKKFRSNSDKRGEGEGEGTYFSFFPFS